VKKFNTIPSIPFYFIRHGETDWNKQKLRQGHTDIPLNETGIKQAQNVAPLLAQLNITRIISSSLSRAHKTAEIINEHLQVPLTTTDGLKECSWGVLEGTARDTIVNIKDWENGHQIENGEHVDSFKERVLITLNEILDPNHTTLIVAHGAVYWAIMEILGFEDQHTTNCEPHFFSPPADGEQLPWAVYPVELVLPIQIDDETDSK
jgi:broad specificity phosphatase PhoE